MDSGDYIKQIIKLEMLFRDEVELLFNQIPNTIFDKKK
jgi:hypothetical protein